MTEDTPSIAAEGPAVAERFQDYLSDESRLPGCADKISLPRDETELVAILQAAAQDKTALTLSGARTGITGGAVPQGGWLLSVLQMDGFLGLRHDAEQDRYLLRCQPGVTLDALNAAVAAKSFPGSDHWDPADQDALARFQQAGPFLFPPDPTETSASVGGMVACNASGARTLHYGPTRGYVRRLRVVLPGGAILDLARGAIRADAQRRLALQTAAGTKLQITVPSYSIPQGKHAAGYYAGPDMDAVDLFIGSEGTLGVFSELELLLVPAPELILGVIAFFESEPDAIRFVRRARGEQGTPLPVGPLALEFFGVNTLNLLRDQKARSGAETEIPELSPAWHTAVYIELPTSDSDMEESALALLEMIGECGSDPDTAWTATTEQETVRLKAFRHAVPESVNQRIGERAAQHPGLTKLGTDFAVPDAALEELLHAYRTTFEEAGLEYVIFGHIGNNHLHANVLPRDMAEYERGKKLYLQLAQRAVALGGTVSGEHGVGKLKTYLLPLLYGKEGIAEMRAVKAVLDPDGILNPGNIFAA